MAIPFLDPSNEDGDTKTIAFWAITGITLGLAGVSTYGVWAQPGEIIGKIFYTLPVVGAEFLCAVTVLRAIQSPTRFRMGLALAVSLGLSWYCVHNVERGIQLAYPDLYGDDAEALRDRATLYKTQASDLGTQATTNRDDLREDRRLLREDIAKLEGEQLLMQATAAEEIKRAQKLLQSKGYYNCGEACPIDGKDESETAAARTAYGQGLQRDLELLRRQEKALGESLSTGAVEASSDKSESQIKEAAKARRREREGFLLTIGTWVLEVSRGLGGYLFLGTATVGALSARRKLEEQIELAELEARLRAARGESPKPDENAPDPPPAPANDDPALTPAQQRSQNAGKASGFAKKTGAIKIPADDWSQRADRMKDAA